MQIAGFEEIRATRQSACESDDPEVRKWAASMLERIDPLSVTP